MKFISRAEFVIGWAALGTITLLYGLLASVTAYILLIIAALSAIALAVESKLRPRVPDLATTGFVVAYLLLAVADALRSREVGLPIVYNFIWLLIFPPLRGTLRHISSEDAPRIFSRLLLVGTALTFTFAAYQRLSLVQNRAGYFNSDPISFANTAIVLGTLSLLGLLAEKGRARLLYLAGPVLGLGVAVLSQTRGAVLTGLAMAALSSLILARNKKKALLVAAAIAIAGTGIFAIAATFHIARAHVLVDGVWQAINGVRIENQSNRTRWAMLVGGIGAIQHSPWVGYGWHNLSKAVRPYLPPEQTQLNGSPHLHNDIVDLMVGFGVFGLLSYLLILAVPLVAAARTLRDGAYAFRNAGVQMMVGLIFLMGMTFLVFGYELHASLYIGIMATLFGFTGPSKSGSVSR